MKKLLISVTLLFTFPQAIQTSDLLAQARANKDLDQKMLEYNLATHFKLMPDGSLEELLCWDGCTFLYHTVALCFIYKECRPDQKRYQDYLKVIALFLALGANPLAQSPNKGPFWGRTPLKLAEDNQHTEVIELLLKALKKTATNSKKKRF